MVIEHKWSLWKPSLFTQCRIRIANELRLGQRQSHGNELREQIALAENDINAMLAQMAPIDFARIDQEINSCIALCHLERKRTLREYRRVKKQLIRLAPKLIVGHGYIRARSLDCQDIALPAESIQKTARKRLTTPTKQQWKKGIREAYQRLQAQRDRVDLSKHDEPVHMSMSIQPLPEEVPLAAEMSLEQAPRYEFRSPLPPPMDESHGVIIPFKTPPAIECFRSPPSDRLQLAADDTIVNPRRLMNKTLGNITQMSFHIDPDHCSSPKGNEKRKKKKLMLLAAAAAALPPPSAPQFSSTAIFDTHAFFTQTTHKTKKQKKKIDIARQPVITTSTNPIVKKKSRLKKTSPYDFQDEDNTASASSRTKGAKLLTDDIITARFAKNSHFQSHQSSMATTKSDEPRTNTTTSKSKKKKKKRKNLLGIGTSSPLASSANIVLSPGRLSTDDDDDSHMKSSLSRRQHRTKRTRVK